MDNFSKAIQPTFPDSSMLQSNAYFSNNLAIIETSFLPTCECKNSQFHFLLPLLGRPDIVSENKRLRLHCGNVMPCNPMQPHHAVQSEITDFKALVIYVKNELLNETAKTMYDNSHLEFCISSFSYTPLLSNLLQAFIKETCTRQPGTNLMLENLAQQIAVTLLRESRHNLSNHALSIREYCNEPSIRKAIEYLNDNYYNEITLADLAKECNYSQYHFLRLFKKYTGKSPFAFLLEIKIEKAGHMLAETDYSIQQVCDFCGFNALSYFSQAFKKSVGMTPTQYKAKYHNKTSVFL